MSGHSKWANIKNRKGAQDQRRSAAFTKISKNIITAIKMGGNNTSPESNSYLKSVLDKAREVNMPKENISRLIDKFESRKDKLESLMLEGFGPHGVPLMVEVETDNRNRTLGEIRLIFRNHQGALGESGSVGYLFERVGEIEVEGKLTEEIELDLIDRGLIEMEDGKVLVDAKDLSTAADYLTTKGIVVTSSRLVMRSRNPIMLANEEQVATVMELIEGLEENEDVSAVYSGFDYHE